MLKISGLNVKAGDKALLNGVDLELTTGEKVLLMGPNGSGKTTLVRAIMGDPSVEIISGKILLGDNDLLKLSPDERAKLGVFVCFQSPVEIPGVNVYEILLAAHRQLYPEEPISVEGLQDQIAVVAGKLGLEEQVLARSLNVGFSGGEKKKLELLQMVVLSPQYVILDEPDSGLDADSVKIVSRAIEMLSKSSAVLLISHDPRRLNFNEDRILLMKKGRIVKEGGAELLQQVTKEGYEVVK